jgi:prolyl oligopeptidase
MSACAAGKDTAGPAPTPRRTVQDEYHGVVVIDDYRWLENWEDPEVQAWSGAQNTQARSTLDALPSIDAIRQRLTELYRSGTTYERLQRAGNSWVVLKRDPKVEQPSIVGLSSPADLSSERTILDPAKLDPKGTTSIDWFVPSPDGRLLAVSLSESGSERGNVHLFETATGRDLGDTIPRVNYGTAGGSVAWAGDGSGIYYTRYPRPGERPDADLDFYTQVYFHKLGTPTSADRYEIGQAFPRIAEIFLRTSPNGRFVLANVANGDGGEYAQYLRGPDGRWTQLTRFEDEVVFATFGGDATLYLLSRRGAPRGSILRLDLNTPSPRLTDASLVVPEAADSAIAFDAFGGDTVMATRDRLYVIDIIGGPNRVRVFTADGQPLGSLAVPGVVSIPEQVVSGDSLLVRTVGLTERGTWYEVAADARISAAPRRLELSAGADDVLADVEVERISARSKDGTEVPITVARRRGMPLNGMNPTLLNGYGGYGVNNGPFFMPGFAAWLEQGGVVAVANIRGGGEFGEAWHLAGNLTHKQNVFDDFLAAAERLIALQYTSPNRLAIIGGSNGGLLMGAAMTQRPELFRAVVSFVGIYDMLRVELSSNGQFNVPEFGTTKNPEHFRAMYAYSPYHHVKDGATYPSTLFLTGANDPRVDPMQSRKMTARLQAAVSGKNTVLLRTSASAGHGFGTAQSEAIEQEVDVYAFLFNALGIDYSERRAAPSSP